MSQPFYARSAEADIMELWAFHAERSEQNARRIVQRIHDKCELLRDFPNLGRARPEIGVVYRSLPVGNYTIFYRYHNERVQIVRVLSANANLAKIVWLDDDSSLPS